MILVRTQYSLNKDRQAAKVIDIKTRPPGCSGQAADAVSAYTQVKMEDASTFFFFFEKKTSQNAKLFGYVY